MMKRLSQVATVAGTVLLIASSQVLANEPKGEGAPDYSGITGMYYVLIGLVLAYGVYDTFLKKN